MRFGGEVVVFHLTGDRNRMIVYGGKDEEKNLALIEVDEWVDCDVC